MSCRQILAIDIGGTFTDIVVLDSDSGDLTAAKVLTSYPDPSEAVLEGLRGLVSSQALEPGDFERAIHGTTLVTNALIQRSGAPTGLITTEGFRDALEIGREGRYDIYDLFLELPAPLVERRLRKEAGGRLNVRGEEIEPLVESDIQKACDEFKQADVEAVAICFIHAYANPEHELRAAEIVRGAMPEAAVTLSHQVAPELREYERTSTAVANAYVQPLARRYMRQLEDGVREAGVEAPLHIMLSNGGSCSPETATAFPVRLVESGPCGGALAAAYWSQVSGDDSVLGFDMGGTTAKAILGRGGEFPVTTESEVARVYRFKRGSGLPLMVPVLDMIEIGAGGGSIARLNELDLPTVGPESAGADPGPACYGQGGELPTVTDADLLLGLLNPEFFLGGSMQLDVTRAERALDSLAHHLEMDAVQMAWGVNRLVNENMAAAARVHAAERGLDIRDHTLVATGGAGPVHACGVAERLGLGRVVVPPAAGVGSAFGLILAPISFDFGQSYVSRLEDLDFHRLNDLLGRLELEGRRIVKEAGVKNSETTLTRIAEMRYAGQGHEIRVPVPEGVLGPVSVAEMQAAFDREYIRLYGRVCEGVPVEAVNWRLTVSGPKPEVRRVNVRAGDAEGDLTKGTRQALFDVASGPVETEVFNRYALPEGFQIGGPAIVEEIESTTVVPPGWSLQLHDSGALVLQKRA